MHGAAYEYLSDLIFLPHTTIWLFKKSSDLVFHLRAFVQSGPCAWHTLLLDIHLSASPSSFRSQLKCHLWREAYPEPFRCFTSHNHVISLQIISHLSFYQNVSSQDQSLSTASPAPGCYKSPKTSY